MRDVIFLPAEPMAFIGRQEETIAQCTTCKAVTVQYDQVIQVIPEGPPTQEIADAMMKLRKRLTFCTHCGSYKITT